MKKLFAITFLILAAIVAVGQDINKKRLSEIDADNAIANDSVGQSVILTKGKELCHHSKEALQYDDYESALSLKKEFNMIYIKNTQNHISIEDSSLTKTVPKKLNINSFISGFYVDGITAIGIFRDNSVSPGGGFSFGLIKYLNKKNKKQQFGIKGQSSFSYYFFNSIFMVDLIQVGPQIAIPFGKNAAFEYGLFCGLTLNYELEESPIFRNDIGTLVSFRISNFTVGLDCNINVVSESYSSYYNSTKRWEELLGISTIVRIGLKAGVKF